MDLKKKLKDFEEQQEKQREEEREELKKKLAQLFSDIADEYPKVSDDVPNDHHLPQGVLTPSTLTHILNNFFSKIDVWPQEPRVEAVVKLNQKDRTRINVKFIDTYTGKQIRTIEELHAKAFGQMSESGRLY